MTITSEQRPTNEAAATSPPSLAILVDRLSILIKTRLELQILVAMVLGVATGLSLSPKGLGLLSTSTSTTVGGWLAFPGQIFLALIQMIVIPLIMSSVMLGIASSGSLGQLRRIGLRIVPYFVLTTLIAVGLGVAVASWIEPGSYIDAALVENTMGSAHELPVPRPQNDGPIRDRIVDLIPSNPLNAALEQRMLQLVVLAILMGIALASIARERATIVVELTASIQEISMKIVSWAMLLAPAAVFGLLAQLAINAGLEAIIGMSVYIGTVLGGLLALLATYLAIVFLFAQRRPGKFLAALRGVQTLAFSTSSSAAVMPLSMKTAQESLDVQPALAQFIIPVGATVNMDGTALYQVVAALFLTQVFGIDLSGGQFALLIATTVGASIGSPSTPGVGIVVLATILQGMGVPPAGLGLIIGVDRILDMSRTAVNVTGDLTACVVMDRWLEMGDEPVSQSEVAAAQGDEHRGSHQAGHETQGIPDQSETQQLKN